MATVTPKRSPATVAVLWLVVGAVAQVAFTSMIWNVVDTHIPAYLWTASPIREWPMPPPPEWPIANGNARGASAWWGDVVYLSHHDPTFDNGKHPRYSMLAYKAGIPFRGSRIRLADKDCNPAVYWVEDPWAPSAQVPGLGLVQIPLRPAWPGFFLNTLFYALIAFALSRIPPLIRHHRRRRTNRCPTCGYPRTDLPPHSPCPECGAAPTPR